MKKHGIWEKIISIVLAAAAFCLIAWGVTVLRDQLQWKALVESFNPDGEIREIVVPDPQQMGWKAIVESFNPGGEQSAPVE